MEIFSKAFNRPKNRLAKTQKSIFNFLFFGEKKIEDNVQLFQLATTSYLHNDVNNALQTINSCIESGSNEKWDYFAFRANCYEDLQEYKKAIENYEIAIELSENDEDVYALYHQIGFCYLNLKNDIKAKEFYTYALQLKTNLQSKNKEDLEGLDGGVLLGVSFQRIYNNRGNAKKNLGELNEAIIDCEKAIEYGEDYSNPYLLLSQIYDLKGDDEKSFENIEIAAILGNQYAIKTITNLISNGFLNEKEIRTFFDKFTMISKRNSMILLLELLISKKDENPSVNNNLKNYLELIEFSANFRRNEEAIYVYRKLANI